MDNKQTAGGGKLAIISILILKLTGVIDWPWIWVLSPFWIPVAVIFLLYFLVY